MLFLDVQGTLISDKDKSLITGAKELLGLLNDKNIPYVIITNNTKDLNFLENLRQKGLEIKEGAYLDPFCVLSSYLKPCKVAAFGADEFINSLENLGFMLDFETPEALLVASYDDFKFKDFAKMIELAQRGVKIIAMHETSLYKKDGLLYPGVGSVMAMLKNATNLSYEVVGKPSKAFYEEALRLINLQKNGIEFSDISIISDDFKGDLLKAYALKMRPILVLSGKIKSIKGLDVSILSGVYESVWEFKEEL
ncbi:HAD-IIA family hydrolase [Campylobacter vulpis]|uniref:HAD family hydrolase n=1 Tax=Campylobacter vulpis TaxID=1655500 RepID=A0A2G4R003_9BACT|nr:HAD-IIA family hydrolase [Campylobacter vulpis]MBS4234725.1 HAD-IIA family hydrolase [Campylobacter vulpis]MBS4241688.1 HAD-IIA family hydrolase [Campylobacter vulpis]MBS4251891.1 HAD-IIA family hydrolase [Campylobacter vulpis]MBS4269734.1 HAD-IIA family hydrolase [Campylobacter vulpis]MBS4274974.1 HAD-IIA family hydrolase [Campylobacter vulpis]